MTTFGNVTLRRLVASQVLQNNPAAHTKYRGKQQDLEAAVSEVSLRTSILGASTVEVTLSDPHWALQSSGLFTVEDGLLSPLEIEFPQIGVQKWWRLCTVEGSTDLSGPNLKLTFESRVASFLRLHWGPKTWPP